MSKKQTTCIVHAHVPQKDHAKLQAIATQNERSLAAQLRVIIREFIERQNAKRS